MWNCQLDFLSSTMYYRSMDTNYALWDTVTKSFVALPTKPVAFREDGSGYVTDGGTLELMSSNEEAVLPYVEHQQAAFKNNGRFVLMKVSPA